MDRFLAVKRGMRCVYGSRLALVSLIQYWAVHSYPNYLSVCGTT
jgi:hypothetical protein